MTMLSSLSQPRQHLVLLLQEGQYLTIEGLQVIGHEPVFTETTHVEKMQRLGRRNRQAKSYPPDFKIKHEFIELFESFDSMDDGEIPVITAIKGLPRVVHFQTRVESA
jgi:hypothetical protein